VKNPVLPHGGSSKEKAIFAIHPRSSGRGILAFSRESYGHNSIEDSAKAIKPLLFIAVFQIL
jgi:hypothetical protein